ncbi:Zinc D-Ala-D-Ala carboxypeptidase precursor [Hartmannibacter diazotrophicus]|uniref:Zinc D-Ala-D-Ala carboxypeptidase n=1 Tax=Hartmannibacter diazotrophicus TaxID=1482074 RepID=A0A2C9D9L4_9HYPH|nr:peptidoglycan-binding protein [Hartmannibacter diazotrophicus]SON56275.1 Zinc D-Ala-D-Ala carboxypeptidase precursor [Hartmannibacter diazotrophicus]
MTGLNEELLKDIAPRVSGARAAHQAEILSEVGAALAGTLADYGIATRLRVAHFLAQIAHESDGFCTTEEYASGRAYEGRKDLGNTEPGDGVRFKGRGLLQLTGRANYIAMSDTLGLDLVSNPALAADPAISLRIACEYWYSRQISRDADRDDIIAVTRKVNGGLNGLADRRVYLGKAKVALAQAEAGSLAFEPGAMANLHRGLVGDAVAILQSRLVAHGYQIAIDGDFGPGTETAVRLFQRGSGLVTDGIVGPATWSALNGSSEQAA